MGDIERRAPRTRYLTKQTTESKGKRRKKWVSRVRQQLLFSLQYKVRVQDRHTFRIDGLIIFSSKSWEKCWLKYCLCFLLFLSGFFTFLIVFKKKKREKENFCQAVMLALYPSHCPLLVLWQAPCCLALCRAELRMEHSVASRNAVFWNFLQ